MEIEIAWSTILKIAAMGIVTYVLAPVLLVVRDGTLWWVIRRFVLTKKVMNTLGEYCLDKAWLDEGYNTPFGIYGSGPDQKFYLGSRQVTLEIFFHQKEHWEKLSKSTAQQYSFLITVEKRIDRIFKYYKQIEENPLRKNREQLYKQFAKSFIDEREKESNKPVQPTANADGRPKR